MTWREFELLIDGKWNSRCKLSSSLAMLLTGFCELTRRKNFSSRFVCGRNLYKYPINDFFRCRDFPHFTGAVEVGRHDGPHVIQCRHSTVYADLSLLTDVREQLCCFLQVRQLAELGVFIGRLDFNSYCFCINTQRSTSRQAALCATWLKLLPKWLYLIRTDYKPWNMPLHSAKCFDDQNVCLYAIHTLFSAIKY